MFNPTEDRQSPQGGNRRLKTMICLILDRSGSMSGLEDDVVGGVNAFLAEQKKLPDEATIAFVRFDSVAVERFREMVPLQECRPLEREEFQPRGHTPLLDAVGFTIAGLEEDWKRLQPDRAIVAIVTDGKENFSREFSKPTVKALIEARQASGKWAFLYFGANVDAFAESATLGISRFNSSAYRSTRPGTSRMFSTMSESLKRMRTTGSTSAHNLGGNIGEQPADAPKPPDEDSASGTGKPPVPPQS
jgi:uncharacterized protein YegL